MDLVAARGEDLHGPSGFMRGWGGWPPLSWKTVGEAWALRAVEPPTWSRHAKIFQATDNFPFPQFLAHGVSQTEKGSEMQTGRQRNGVWEGTGTERRSGRAQEPLDSFS